MVQCNINGALHHKLIVNKLFTSRRRFVSNPYSLPDGAATAKAGLSAIGIGARLTEALSPTLEDLRHVPEPAWLWDGARARVVWANAPGIAWFGAQTLFDLIDRLFDSQEGGVSRIAGLARSLRHGQVETCLLHFPSVTPAPIASRCMSHALADGRPGVLVVAGSPPAADRTAQVADMAAAFDLLPTPAILIARDGAIRQSNAAALILLGAGQRASLAAILGDAAAADDLIARLSEAGTVSRQESLTVRFGRRDIRIVARRLLAVAGDGAYALVLLDDVTERRALERQLPQAVSIAATPLAAGEAEAFQRLGEVLRRETAPAEVRQPAAHKLEAVSAAQQDLAQPEPPRAVSPRQPQALPVAVRQAIDGLPQPVIIAQNGRLLYANPHACALFSYSSAAELVNDPLLWDRFGQLGQSLPASLIEGANGRSLTASVQMMIIPWLGGPARQFVLRPLATGTADVVAFKVSTQDSVKQAAPPPADPPPTVAPAAEIIDIPAPAASVLPPVAEAAVAPAEPVTAGNRDEARSEPDEELRAILDTVADGIITLDAKGRIHSFSAGAEAIFGYRISEVLGRPFVDLIAPDSRKAVRDYLAALQGPGLASVFNDGREVIAQVKQGGTVPLFLTLGRLQAAHSTAALCAVVRDITQWKKTEVELREARDTAVATSRQKSEFLARISHELRTPLNAIMGFSEVMRLQRFGKIENDKYLGYVNDIHASGGHLLSLINDLLDLSKVEAGKLELNFTSVGLSDVADHVLRMLQEEATAARVVMRKAMPADLPHVVADLRSMRQILLNLVSNALKFTDPGGQVIISAQTTPAGELKLRVKDTGIGMNEDQLSDALEPFRRVTTAGRNAPGTGLGLPLTKALAEANRTHFAITSEPRKGTMVEITFPTTRVLAS